MRSPEEPGELRWPVGPAGRARGGFGRRDRLARELAAARALSNRRAVDDVKQRAAEVEGGGDEFVGATHSLIETTIELVNWSVPIRVGSTCGTSTASSTRRTPTSTRVAALESALQVSHVDYGKAASRFDTRATAFSSAVERLKRQLEHVAP